MRKLIMLVVFLTLFCISMPVLALDAPTLTVTTSGINVSLSWTSVLEAEGYTLYYAPPDISYIGDIDMGTETSFSIDLSEGAAFYVAVTAYNSFGSSEYSNIEYFDLSPENQWENIALISTIDKVQPMTGIVLWADSHTGTLLKNSDEYIQLEYAYVAPGDVVQELDQYDWSIIESLLDDVASRGHQAILRWYYVYPGQDTTVPDYIKLLDDYSEVTGLSEGLTTSFPDWTNSELQSFHLDFYTKFAERYDNDPRIAFLQVGFGLWGEYHIYDGPNVIGEQFPSHSFQTTFLNHLDNIFTTLCYSISIDAGDSYYSPIAASAQLQALEFGLFDDSFMNEEHDEYNQQMWALLNYTHRFQISPHGGELSYYSDYDQEHALDSAGMYGRTYEQLSSQFYISYMIGNDQPLYQSNDRIKIAGLANGYKFTITDFQTSQTQSKVTVTNTGIAPIYYDAFIVVNGLRAAASLKGLLPDEEQEFTIASGGDNPVLTIECDRLVAGQNIQFEANLTGQ